MKILGIHCPYCGGNIKFDIDSGKRHCFCVHCGQQIILDDEVIRTEHVEIERDETKIYEADVNERIRFKELEMEENRRISTVIPRSCGPCYIKAVSRMLWTRGPCGM